MSSDPFEDIPPPRIDVEYRAPELPPPGAAYDPPGEPGGATRPALERDYGDDRSANSE